MQLLESMQTNYAEKMNKLAKLTLFLFFMGGLVISAKALAEDLPVGAEPGAGAGRYQREFEQQKEKLEKEKAKPAEIEKKEEEKKPVSKEKIYLILKELKITGVTVFTAQELEPLYAPYIDKKVSFEEISAIAEKIKDKYYESGYVTTNVFIPTQTISEGKVEIVVIEGKMGSLKIEGNKWFSGPLLKRFFHLQKNKIFNVRILQRDLLRVNKNPDLEAKVILTAGSDPETSDIILKVKENFPYHLSFTSDNQGTRLTGKNRGSFLLRSSNATANFDSLFVNTLFSSLTFGESLGYSIPVGTYGNKFGLNIIYFTSKIGKEFKTSHIRGESQILNPYFSWELFLSEGFEAYADLGLEVKSIKKETNEASTCNDQLRLPYFIFHFTKNEISGEETSFSPRFSFGTEHFLGASGRNHPTTSRQGTGGFFFKYEQEFTRTQRMPLESYTLIRSQFQAASHTLPSSEQLQLGGANSIRGYPEGDYLADMGGSLNLEWFFPMYPIPKDWKLPNSDLALRYQIQPVIFLDLGGGKTKKDISGEKHEKFLMGVGGGLRLRLLKKIFLRLDWAEHIGDRPTSGSGPSTFYFTFQSEI